MSTESVDHKEQKRSIEGSQIEVSQILFILFTILPNFLDQDALLLSQYPSEWPSLTLDICVKASFMAHPRHPDGNPNAQFMQPSSWCPLPPVSDSETQTHIPGERIC